MTKIAPPPSIPGFTSKTANVNGVRLHYWLGGDPHGQPVLLWHGFLSTSYAWRKVAPALADAGFAVLVPDMRGFGDSDKPAGTEGYDARALAEEFRALVRYIGFGNAKPIILAAHDMGGPPALLWAADHPEEVEGLLYIEAPVMLSQVLTKIIAYTPEAMKNGSMWWWILPLAPDVPERLVVGNERAFLTWFYDRDTARRSTIEPETVNEYLRTFSGSEGVLGAMGVYRAAFISMEQTAPLVGHKVHVPVVALGGEKGLGAKVGEMIKMVAKTVDGSVLKDCGHFFPEERPEEIVRYVRQLTTTRKHTNWRITGEVNNMSNNPIISQTISPIPADNPLRNLAVADSKKDRSLRHLGIVGDTYTILLSGDDTAGRYCLIDMHIPPGGGPPPHRHDFEESFTILEGGIEASFRGKKSVVRAGETINIPANAPHSFTNASKEPARLLCICSPAGQEELFLAVGVPVATRTTPPPKPDKAAEAEMMAKTIALLPKYRTEMIKP